MEKADLEKQNLPLAWQRVKLTFPAKTFKIKCLPQKTDPRKNTLKCESRIVLYVMFV